MKELSDEHSSQLLFETLIAELAQRFVDITADSLDGVLTDSLATIGHAFGADTVVVYRAAEGHGVRLSTWSRSPEADVPALDDPSAARFAWSAAELLAGRMILAHREEDFPTQAEAERALARADPGATATAPLRVASRFLGAITLRWGTAEPEWTRSFRARFALVAQLLSTAVHRRILEGERLDTRRFEDAMRTIASKLIDAPADTLEDVLLASLDEIQAGLGLTSVSLAEVRASERTYRIVRQAGAQGSFPDEWRPVWPGSYDRALAEGYVVLETHDIVEPAVRTWWESAGIGAVASIILCRDERTLGLLNLNAADRRPFEGDFARRVLLLQDVVGSALARRDAERARRRAFEELARMKSDIERERDYLREEIRVDHGVSSMIVASPALSRVLDLVDAVASTTATVLIRGETGVGKELIARAIHARSPRADAPLVKVNCASIPRELFESEFFGHVRGSFTGAHRDRVGRFELADKGTIFLDEVGEIPPELQVKLLRVLQEGEIERIGDDRVRAIDVRIVAATNRDLEADVEAHRFRRDLYYRLSVFPIVVPPLSERREDIVPLARHFVARFSKEMGRPGLELTSDDEARLLTYPWPGNVRELAHTIERAVILSPRPPLRLDLALPDAERRAAAPETVVRTQAEMRELERANLIAALEKTGWRVAGPGGAAHTLGMSPSTVRDRMRALKIVSPRRAR